MSDYHPYPTWVICIDGKPLEEDDGSYTLYQEMDDDLVDRFKAIVYLTEDASRITIKKFDLVPHVFADSLSKKEFIKRARETKREG